MCLVHACCLATGNKNGVRVESYLSSQRIFVFRGGKYSRNYLVYLQADNILLSKSKLLFNVQKVHQSYLFYYKAQLNENLAKLCSSSFCCTYLFNILYTNFLRENLIIFCIGPPGTQNLYHTIQYMLALKSASAVSVDQDGGLTK